MDIWKVLDVNPEPWVVPNFAVVKGKHSSKAVAVPTPSQQLKAFQDAVQEALEGNTEQISGEIKLTLYFWRRLEQYQGKIRKVTKNQLDATNMQKATEDALQGVLFSNDRLVQDVRSVIVEQSLDAEPRIVLHIEPWSGLNPDEIPSNIWSIINKEPNLFSISDNAWPPRSAE